MFSYSSFVAAASLLHLSIPLLISTTIHHMSQFFWRLLLLILVLVEFHWLFNFLPSSLLPSLPSSFLALEISSSPAPLTCLQAFSLVVASVLCPPSQTLLKAILVYQAFFFTFVCPCVFTNNSMASQLPPSFSSLPLWSASNWIATVPTPCSILHSLLYSHWPLPPSVVFYHCHIWVVFMQITSLPPYFAHSPITSSAAAVCEAELKKKKHWNYSLLK